MVQESKSEDVWVFKEVACQSSFKSFHNHFVLVFKDLEKLLSQVSQLTFPKNLSKSIALW